MASVKSQRFDGWADFKNILSRFADLPNDAKRSLVFRGHSDGAWTLKARLDRIPRIDSPMRRKEAMDSLLREFEIELRRLGLGLHSLPTGDTLEALARHCGMETTLLDWTYSPYVAAYFAFEGATSEKDVAVWMLDRRLLPAGDTVQMLDSPEVTNVNTRVRKQRGLFSRLGDGQKPMEEIIPQCFWKFQIPGKDRATALADLDQMLINATILFDDSDGAARTASMRAFAREKERP